MSRRKVSRKDEKQQKKMRNEEKNIKEYETWRQCFTYA